MILFLRKIWHQILWIFFPKRCVDCSKIGEDICKDCFEKIEIQRINFCPNCREKTKMGEFCSEYCKEYFTFERLIVCVFYSSGSVLRKLIFRFKYKFCFEIGEKLAEIVMKKFNNCQLDDENLVIIPVPIHKKRLKFRGFNQCLILANLVSRKMCNSPPVFDCLERIIFDGAQMKKGRSERISSLKGAVRLKPSVKNFLRNKEVLLVDDVATTCSTLNECARVLKEVGVTSVSGLVLARGY